ncbi:YbaN family protein [Cellvibrio sp. UBA7661]|uniref:YbaN family protein n=1 Tax=Cellvibrio sp. UBA7661 TaxID=1946311 RepID=UPI002F35B3AF
MSKHTGISLPEKVGYLALACVSLFIGLVGIVTPLLPTTPLLLLSAWSAAKGSPRLHHWLINHPQLGKPVVTWQQEHAIPAAAKKLALFMLACSWLVMAFIDVDGRLLVASFFFFIAIATFIWTRPLPQDENNISAENITLYKGCRVYSDIRAYSDPEVFHE